MRITTLMTMIAPVFALALAGCDAGEETDNMPMANEDMPMHENMPMEAEDMPMEPGGMAMMQSGETARTASSEGMVTAIDADAGTITIDHRAVPDIDWPAMTMAFDADEALRSKVTVGDAVKFKFRTSDAGDRIISINER